MFKDIHTHENAKTNIVIKYSFNNYNSDYKILNVIYILQKLIQKYYMLVNKIIFYCNTPTEG